MKPVTVSQLNMYLGRIVATDPILNRVSVKGEVSYIKYHGSGNVYMTLSDGKSRLNCFVPGSRVPEMDGIIKEGDRVEATGSIRIYEPNGTYSLNVRFVEKEGMGELYEKFLKTRAKLEAEGLFDPARKKELPVFPGHVGVITSETGAGAKDIIKIIKSRNRFTDVTLFPSLVQGPDAPQNLKQVLEMTERDFAGEIDVIIIGRGGGAPEDLAAFDDEALARAVADCKIPVISAVGHEIDFSITDFTADVRAETPTAAAQLAVPDTGELRRHLGEMMEKIHSAVSGKVIYEELAAENVKKELCQTMERALQERKESLEKYKLVLEERNPAEVISKGYAVIEGLNGKRISGHSDIEDGNLYSLYLADGKRSYRLKAEKGESCEQ